MEREMSCGHTHTYIHTNALLCINNIDTSNKKPSCRPRFDLWRPRHDNMQLDFSSYRVRTSFTLAPRLLYRPRHEADPSKRSTLENLWEPKDIKFSIRNNNTSCGSNRALCRIRLCDPCQVGVLVMTRQTPQNGARSNMRGRHKILTLAQQEQQYQQRPKQSSVTSQPNFFEKPGNIGTHQPLRKSRHAATFDEIRSRNDLFCPALMSLPKIGSGTTIRSGFEGDPTPARGGHNK